MLVGQIKKILSDIETNGVDDLIMTKVNLQALDKGYQESGVESPEWIIDGINSLTREITDRNRSQLIGDLKRAKARREAASTLDEKRKKLDSEIEALEKKLA